MSDYRLQEYWSMNKKTCRFAAIGECMIELVHQDEHVLNMGFAGDTLNVCTYLARYSDLNQVNIEYVTALGDDPYSQMMVEAWQTEGVGHQLVSRLTGKLPGLYLIRTDEQGERHFYFYRSQSAARDLFKTKDIKELCDQLLEFDYLYISGISIAILDEQSRDILLNLLKTAVERNCIICFDSNYRQQLWHSVTKAREIMNQFLPFITIALASFGDDEQLFGDQSMQDCAERYHAAGVQEVVVKRGGESCFLSYPEGQQQIPFPPIDKVVDATAAGDSFNGAYLAARIKGLPLRDAVLRGIKVSTEVIQHRGAIIPKERLPKI